MPSRRRRVAQRDVSADLCAGLVGDDHLLAVGDAGARVGRVQLDPLTGDQEVQGGEASTSGAAQIER